MRTRAAHHLRTAESTHVTAESPRARRHRRERTRCGSNVTLHLVDIDNLLGDPTTVNRALIDGVFEQYRSVAGYEPGDHVVVATGCNGMHVLEVELAWRGVRHCRKRGRDGADHILCAEAEWAAANGGYDRVVIASGDHAFMTAYQGLLAAGFDVDIVANHRRLAPALAALAHGHVRYFGTPAVPAPEVLPAA